MDFSEALGYSFKGYNIPKILTIVLVFVIVGVSIIVAGIALESIALLFLFVPLLIGYALFIMGYTISVIRSVMSGEEAMPEFAIGTDLTRGFMLLLASIVYSIPVIVIFACIFTIAGAGISSTSSSFEDAAGNSMLMFCALMLVVAVVGFIVNYALIIGQIRYATEERTGALFDFGTNFGTVFSNLGTTFGLFFRQLGIGIVFGIISSILTGIIQAMFGGVMNDLTRMNDMSDIVSLGMPLAIFFSLYYIVTLTISLMQGFSVAHLIAGYGQDLGFGANKFKNDNMM